MTPEAADVPTPHPTPAGGIQRARELLTAEAAVRAEDPEALTAGYLDLLGDDLKSTGATQDLMTTRLVPGFERDA